ncbi:MULTISPECIES: reverse transcriptase domain-containing protein [unclassified Pseudomonas]|uniref:reverse transcriptase domain-containing protein n=1 Tax=unclassified Pseudomonas TaxID=196821 RepID=UPI001F577C17|nr:MULTISPECIES: reverse transcriptase domain-containing protein [unclassified Pseudomonas]
MLNELAKLLHGFLATDQSYHAQQQSDGTYRKRAGAITSKLLEKNIKDGASLAIYQKNTDLTIKWICFDFDILKSNLNDENRSAAQAELERSVDVFCQSLDSLGVPYLLEFSGNRGFHIWITFREKISYRTGFEIEQALLDAAELSFNKDLIAIDLFPSTPTPTDGVGMGVKSPLSKHTKSKQYATLLGSPNDMPSLARFTELDDEIVRKNLQILLAHKSTSKSEIENSMGVFFETAHDEEFHPARIKSIKVQNNGFSLCELLSHWEAYAPLNALGRKIEENAKLNHEERKLLVGLLCNIQAKNIINAGSCILHEIFSKAENYDSDVTNRALKKLSSFNFPSQEQIERATKVSFSTTLSVGELLTACIPKFVQYEDATFEISRADIEITKAAELSYLFLNDEAQSKNIINELASDDNDRLYNLVCDVISNPRAAGFYKHLRNEKNKIRLLVTLKAPERIATSCILKQLIYFLNFQPSINSHGYRPNKGFSGGYIFQPWLYLWIKFVSNISEAIEDAGNQECYIVKTDIKSFYDMIPHDNLKRMLLGGTNSRIEAKSSALSESSKASYKAHIDTLFDITEKTVDSKIGLPQGPAYARYLAEIYLDNLDQLFDTKIQKEELYLYQRYVDDIFFIAPNEEAAKSVLNELRTELSLLGLEINNEKTVVTQIKNFSEDFDSYRSQSKYAVDKVSKNYADSTDTQKNLAITEFMNLVQSDSCDNDLAFIFSHLAGVPQLDTWKREKVEPTLKEGIGRGSLYKHLFNFVLDSQENWAELYKVARFDELQSEVLTACIITVLESSKSVAEPLKRLIVDLESKLSPSELTNENLAYLAIVFGADIDIKNISPNVIINSLKAMQSVSLLSVTTPLVNQINTSLNDIKSLPDFVEAMYPLCASTKISRADLNNLAITFYAKLSTDESNGKLSTTVSPEIDSPSIASKYYYLLCLFSISSKNKSPELLASAWKYCAHVFNSCDAEITHKSPDWFSKIVDIEYSEEKALLIISAIIDGNIFRGLDDKRKVFEKFHNLLLIYITFQDGSLKSANVEKALEAIKHKAVFYKWLIEKDDTLLFPTTNKSWFEKNIIENSSIMLKKGNLVLFRKPTAHFHPSSMPASEHNGYSEVIVEYNSSSLNNLAGLLAGQSTSQKLKQLLSIISFCSSGDTYPNIFCRDRILSNNTLLPFSNELMNSRAIIFEDRTENVEPLVNNQKNFIRSYFRSEPDDKKSLLSIKEKYIDNLDDDLVVVNFIKYFSLQLEEINDIEDDFHFDIAAAAALYLCMKEAEPVRRIDKFINQYHRCNQSTEDRHIYAVDQNTKPRDKTPIQLLETVEASLKIIPTEVSPSLSLYLHKDIEQYRYRLSRLVEFHDSELPALDIDKFVRVYPRISPLNESLNINGRDYKFKNIKLINITTNEVVPFEARHTVAISSSEHIYFFEGSPDIYVASINSSISKVYDSVVKRAGKTTSTGITIRSYPASTFDAAAISSLNNFDSAIDVISQHRDVTRIEAQKNLIKWLGALPKKFHQMLITLISAHVVMRKDDIDAFSRKVEGLLQDQGSNPFLIKRIGDYNGTHRVLFKFTTLGRDVDRLSPLNISPGANHATLVTDNIISGAQIISSMRFYLLGVETRSASNNFEVAKHQQEELVKRLKGLSVINICTILYTSAGVKKIEVELKKLIGPHLSVKLICGKDIGDDALFGSTTRIGEQDKNLIRGFLRDLGVMQELFDHLDTIRVFKQTTLSVEDEINNTNLVARYQSLPKKCFNFLRTGLRHETNCHPLTRVLEINE